MKKTYELPEIKIVINPWTDDIITESLGDGGITPTPGGIDAGGDF